MTKHILVPYDGSMASRNAFDRALEMAKENKAKITLIAALDLHQPSEEQFDEIVIDGSLQLNTVRDKQIVEKQLPELQSRARQANVQLECKYISGMMQDGVPSGRIVKFATNNEVDLIVSGNRENGTQSLLYL